MIILHYVLNDRKFTEGYIRFFATNFKQHEHRFVLFNKGVPDYMFRIDKSYELDDNIAFVQSHVIAKQNGKVRSWFYNSDMIIISGLFGTERCMLRFPPSLLKKTYVHLWGGDFYRLNEIKSLKRLIRRTYKKFVIENAAGVINLIPGDYDKLCQFLTPKGHHFVAPMSDNGEARDMFEELQGTPKTTSPVTIMLGHSGDFRGNHIEALELLSKFKDEDIKIICPMSYVRKMDYVNRVKEYGKEIFGDKFEALEQFMDKKDYFSMIGGATVAVYNHDRQQAMGNINAALALGCKVFMRNDTSMWVDYQQKGFQIFDIQSIRDMEFDEFTHCPKVLKENWPVYLKNADAEKKIAQWKELLDFAENSLCGTSIPKRYEQVLKNYSKIYVCGVNHLSMQLCYYAKRNGLQIEAIAVANNFVIKPWMQRVFPVPIYHADELRDLVEDKDSACVIMAVHDRKGRKRWKKEMKEAGFIRFVR